MIVRVVIIALVLILAALFIWGQRRTRNLEKSDQQAAFAGGQARELPAGRYQGSTGQYHGSWQGKVIYTGGHGANLFIRDGREELTYPFKQYVSRGVRDKNLAVVVLDYNQPGNPFWLRLIRDEVVATGETTYLGKVHLRVVPNFYFTLGYFSLKK